jgi:hypothetical protein
VLGTLLFYWLFHTLLRKRSVFGDLGSARRVGSAFDCAFGGGNFGLEEAWWWWCLVSSSWVSAFVALVHMMTAMGGFFFLPVSLIPL